MQKNKLLGLLLAAAMLFSLLPAATAAAQAETEIDDLRVDVYIDEYGRVDPQLRYGTVGYDFTYYVTDKFGETLDPNEDVRGTDVYVYINFTVDDGYTVAKPVKMTAVHERGEHGIVYDANKLRGCDFFSVDDAGNTYPNTKLSFHRMPGDEGEGWVFIERSTKGRVLPTYGNVFVDSSAENFGGWAENADCSGKVYQPGETFEFDGCLVKELYAVNLSAGALITEVSAEITAPVVGAKPDYTASIVGGSKCCSVRVSEWCKQSTPGKFNLVMSGNDTFKANASYKAVVVFTAKDGYVLTADTKATVNGISRDGFTVKNRGLNDDGDLVVWVTLPAQEQQDGELCDVNGDGEVDNVDAAIVLQYDAGILDEADIVNFSLGDVNGDGEVDNVDASVILQYDAGLIDKF